MTSISRSRWRSTIIVVLSSLASSGVASAADDAVHGLAPFQTCAACHSVNPGEQMTGPSLANIWHRKAGTVPGFDRYSDAMKRAKVVWNEETLDQWLTHPEALIPGTSMTFPGLRERESRRDVIAYLKTVSERKAPAAVEQSGGTMNTQPGKVNLKKAPPEGQVTAISHCRDTYSVQTADGKVENVWEFNLRFKTDSSALGPQPGKPVVVGAGMQGDRASVVFAKPGEISALVKESCP